MTSEREKRILELAGQLCDETLSEADFAELDTLLRDDAEARECYRAFMVMHRRMDDHQPEVVEAEPNTGGQPRMLWLGLAAGFVLALIGLALTPLWKNPTPPERVVTAPPQPAAAPPMAVLTRAIDVEWSHHKRFQAELGEPIETGWLRFDSGVLEVTFSSGATVTAEGPGQLRIDSPLNIITRCKLAAHCPPSAYGFTVRFNGGKVVDLGTEFAIDPQPEGKTKVHVLDGEVIVALTDESEKVLKEQNLTEQSAVTLDPDHGAIEASDFDASSFKKLQRSELVRSQPIKLQFDLGHRAGVYDATNAPGHSAGDLFAHEHTWNLIVGDQSGNFPMADGNLCPWPIKVDYGRGNAKVDWDAEPENPRGSIYRKAQGVFNTTLSLDHRPADGNLGFRVSGLPAGTYRVYGLCRSTRRPEAFYAVSFGKNLDRQLNEPFTITPLVDPSTPEWVAGQTHAMGEVTIDGIEDWVTLITRITHERNPPGGPPPRTVLLGVQLVQIK